MIPATWGLTYWPIYLIVVSLGFIPAETTALITNPANTLSDFAWRELGFPDKASPVPYTAAWYFSFAAYVMVVVFLAIHIWFRRLR